ncbi:hypothetical protein EVAR_68012_1 [Eumeta japonica]|uniref:Uncharacterized protein n=1 Tax=Eumeta variegata TaxID=151549 RepID=A0A4C1ZI21_EUMVA|nr:hypothetical protein EVAR_68012_1 [Eumeta japonica]
MGCAGAAALGTVRGPVLFFGYRTNVSGVTARHTDTVPGRRTPRGYHPLVGQKSFNDTAYSISRVLEAFESIALK